MSKVFPDAELTDSPYERGTALSNEIYAFQVAYRGKRQMKDVAISVHSPIREALTVRAVGLAPSELPVYDDHDDNVVRTTPGLFPDPLLPPDEYGLTVYPGQWRALWITFDPQGKAQQPGKYPIRIDFSRNTGEVLASASFELEVVPAALPDQKLIHTEWFHTDCLAVQYGTDVFSERHWELIGQYVDTAVRHGINMILTPLFTPPLDTQVGGERPTVQLVDVEKIGQTYRFGFDRLERWVKLCLARGVEYFEFSHLFTQWGARHAPKIMATENGAYKQVFGWETDASGEEYRSFLDQFLPALTAWIKANGLASRSYFHVSDEPSIDQLESYGKAVGIVQRWLEDFPIIDALSDIDFYSKGLVKTPIPANNHIEPFLERGVEPLWTYYCCVQYKQVANRFFSMPSARNRIIGVQLYKYNATGFLHWGYNFWFSQYSRKPVDPFRITDADGAFASGDSFLVYPGEGGPIESIRLEVMREALQDLRALQLAETLCGRERVLAELEAGLDAPITFSSYPTDAAWLLGLRERINAMIKAIAGNA